MKKLILCMVALAAIFAGPGFSDKFHDRPDPNATGGINGKVAGAALQDAIAIEQSAYMFYQGRVNAAAGTYTFTNLPPGKYDLMLKLEEDVIEGLRLDIWGENEELSEEDRKAIWDLIRISDDFYHDKKIVRSGGTQKKQKLIVEQIRTKTIFHGDGSIAVGQMLRRIDYIVLRKTLLVWQIESCRNIYRKMRPKTGKGSKLNWHYNSALGGIRVADDTVTVKPVKLKKPKDKDKK